MLLYLAVSQEECRVRSSNEAKKNGYGIRRDYQVELKHPESANDPDRTQISLVDIRRAYFNAKVSDDDPIFVELPPEDPNHKKMCGRLNRHLYVTRRAAAGWEDEYAQTMVEKLGFKRGLASDCIFTHPQRRLRCNVYGDDFTTTGGARDLDWFESELEKHYAITRRGRLGPGDNDTKQATLLNRVITWTE